MKTGVRTLSLAMVACSLAVVTARAADDPNDPAAPHEPGLYYYSEAGGEKKMTKIDPTSYGKTKQGFAFFGVYGQQTKQKAVIEGGHASPRDGIARHDDDSEKNDEGDEEGSTFHVAFSAE